MSNIVDRLRDRAYSTKAGDPLCEEAASEMVRLRWRLMIRENIIRRLVAENERLRVTDEERATIEIVADWADDHLGEDDPGVVALRSLLERVLQNVCPKT